MLKKLRKILFSVPVLAFVALFALYLLVGYFALPAAIKWQAEKQVHEKLAHRLRIAEVRFDPLTFEFEIRDLALSDAESRPMLSFQRLFVDFELRRSVIDRAWSFAAVVLDAPSLNFEFDKDGRHNFSALLERLGESDKEEATQLPHLVIERMELNDGSVAVSDRMLAEPMVVTIAPLVFEADALSTVAARPARYRLTAPSAAGETLEIHGELTANPVAAKGELKLSRLQVATLARALSRFVAIASPAGQIDAGAKFDVSLERSGSLSGTAEDVELAVASLSLSAPGGSSPLLALERLTLNQGRVDLEQREIAFAGGRLARGRVGVSIDAQGRLDWAALVQERAESSQTGIAAAQVASASGSSAPAPWRVSIANAEVAELAVRMADASRGRNMQIDAIALNAAPDVEVGSSSLKLRVDHPSVTLAGVRLEQGADFLAAPELRFEAGGLSVARAGAELEAAFDAPRVLLSGAAMSQSGQDATLRDLSIDGEEWSLRSATGRLEIDLKKLRSVFADLQVKRAQENLVLRGAEIASDKVSLVQGQAGLRIEVGTASLAGTGIRATQGERRAVLEELSLKGASALLTSADDGGLTLALQTPRVVASGVAMSRGEDGLDLRDARFGAQSLSLTQGGERFQLAGRVATASVAGVVGRQGEERIALNDGEFNATAISVRTDGQTDIDEAALRIGALQIVALGARSDLAQVASMNLAGKSIRLSLPDGSVELAGDGLAAELSSAVLRSPRDATELLRLGRATLAGGTLRLRERRFSADALTLAQGEANTWLDAAGRFNLLSLLGGENTATADPAAAAAPSNDAPWRIALKQAQFDQIAVGFEDRRESPTFALRLEPIRARIAELDTGSPTPMQLEVQAALASGGDVRVTGSVRADGSASDLNLSIAGIALAPLQTYLSRFAELRIASGTASSKGRLRHGDAAGGGRLEYQGSLAVNSLLLEELAAKRPFLSWDSVSSDDVLLTLEPNRVDIGELRVDKPAGRLIIAADGSVNLADILKKAPAAAAGSADANASADSVAPGETTSEIFPISVARLRVATGELEFADLSLRPQFATRMHELKGVITSLGTDPKHSARLQLDARVDQYGSAKIRGQISVLRPERLTEIEMIFRNLEMTSLSPYVAKFAGYRIVAGRLDLDLQYKVRDGKLQGTNKIVLNQMELGEKVASPAALDLPLELAVAILTDSKGVIDIGVPVSGNLDDPKFDYGAVIGKAIGNLLGGIVSSPFRALGALFGSGDKPLDEVSFDPGDDALAPPERQKLAAIARAMNERPGLMLVVPPTFAAAQDTPALKSLAVRSEIVKRMGIELARGEDPGPIDVSNARTQRAIESAFSTHYAPEVLAVLKRRAIEATAPAPAAPATASAGSPPTIAPPQARPTPQKTTPERAPPVPSPPPAFYQGLVERLFREQPVTDEVLVQLATRRAEAVLRELTDAGGVPAARSRLGEPRQASEADEQSVQLRLELEVTK